MCKRVFCDIVLRVNYAKKRDRMKKCPLLLLGAFLTILISCDTGISSDTTNIPSVPQNFKTTEVTSTTISFTWSASVYASSYELYYNSYDSVSSAVSMGTCEGNECKLKDCMSGRKLYYWVKAKNYKNESDYSETLCVTTLIGVPTSFKIADSSDTSFSLYWNEQVSNEGNVFYSVKYQKTGGSETEIEVEANTCIISGLSKNETYTVKVAAFIENDKDATITDYCEELTVSTNEYAQKFDKYEILSTANSLSLTGLNKNKIYLVNYTIDAAASFKNYRYITSNLTTVSRSVTSTEPTTEQLQEVEKIENVLEFAKQEEEKGHIVSGVYPNGFVRLEYQEETFEDNVDDSSRTLSRATEESAVGDESQWSIGYEKDFYADSTTKKATAKLVAIGDYCYVWIAEDNLNDSSEEIDDNLITTEQIEKVQEKFDFIYSYVTAVFGDKYQGTTKAGFIEPKEKISIFIYDIDGDYIKTQTSGVVGCFRNSDFLATYSYSNKNEMLYIDAYSLDKWTDITYSTLAHEFQHMLRYVNNDMVSRSDTWCNEMLSMLCEDMMQDKLGISDDDSPKGRFYEFVSKYPASSVFNSVTNTLDYAMAYAFGSWLVRNYGGIDLLSVFAGSSESGTELVLEAVNTVNSTEYTMDDLFNNFVQALLYPLLDAETADANGVTTFNRTVSATHDFLDGVTVDGQTFATYTFSAINLSTYYYQLGQVVYNGMLFYPATSTPNISSFAGKGAFLLQYYGEATGKITINFSTSQNENIATYIFVQ